MHACTLSVCLSLSLSLSVATLSLRRSSRTAKTGQLSAYHQCQSVYSTDIGTNDFYSVQLRLQLADEVIVESLSIETLKRKSLVVSAVDA